MKTIKKTSLLLLLLMFVLASCDKDDDNVVNNNSYEVPTSYNFENASYSGQIDRLNMLAELENYLKGANSGDVVDAFQAKAMYANDGYTWTSDPFAIDQPTKDLKSKTFDTQQDVIEAWIDELADLSVNGSTTSSLDGSKTYLFNENGFEPIQMIAKGIMGSCFYYQGTSVYLSDAKMDLDKDVASLADGEYTSMQHHFDESFGYFGAPTDFSVANSADGAYWGKYATKTLNGNLQTIDHLMQDGFILGRAAIDNLDYTTRDAAIATIQTQWEHVVLCSALHYLNGSIDDLSDDALRNHKLSEAIAFMSALKWNSQATMSPTEVDATIDMLGTNLNEVTAEMINDTRTSLADAYGITNASDF